MKLYYVVGSPNCRKVHATISHLGTRLEMEYLDFFRGDLRKPEYLRLNPNGKVPTLRDGNLVLWESNAIMQYLADQTPGNTLLPGEGGGRADVLRWQCWELAHYNRAFGQLAWETVAKPNFLKAEPDPALVGWAQQELKKYAAVLDRHLENRDYAVGDGITLADYSLIHQEAFKEAVPFDWSPFAGVNAYYERMRAAPHWANTAPPSREAIGHVPQAA
jgi:glutathione S-transferase